MYESKFQPLISRNAFILRMVKHLLVVILLVAVSVFIGMVGYWYFEEQTWGNAFMHTSFLLFGFGHLTQPQNLSGQIFLGFYGLYASLVFVIVVGVLFTPIAHRLLHALQIEEPTESNKAD